MAVVFRTSDEQLLELVVGAIEQGLDQQVPWLTNIYGRCERLVKEQGGSRRYTPNWYKGCDE